MPQADPHLTDDAGEIVSQRLTTMKHVVANGADYSCLTCGATVYERDLYMALLEGHEQVSRYTVRDFTMRCESCIEDAAQLPEFKITPPPEDPEVYISTASIAEASRVQPGIVGAIRDNIVLPFEERFATDGDEWYGSPDQPVLPNHDPNAPTNGESFTHIPAPADDRNPGDTEDDEWTPPKQPGGLLNTFIQVSDAVERLWGTSRTTKFVALMVGVAGVSAGVAWGPLAGVAVVSMAVAGTALYNRPDAESGPD